MLAKAMSQMKVAFILLVLFTLLTGLIYPAIVTGIAQLFFPWRANGSMIEQNGKLIGSELIGQPFSDAKYFWSRPSATTPFPYNAANSSGSNLGPSNPDFLATVKDRVAILQKADPQNNMSIPVDLVTSSGSGLDPEISPLAAYYQVHRVAKARKLSDNKIIVLLQNAITHCTFGLLGEPRVNVLQLNIALDQLQ